MAITKVTRNMLTTGIVDNSNATAITIDSSENVGIGVTPEANWRSTVKALDLGATGAFWDGHNYSIFANNVYEHTDTDRKHKQNGFGSSIEQYLGTISFNRTTSGSADAVISGSTTMFLDTSGNVGIGTSTPSTGFNTNRNNLVISDASAAGLTINSTATDGSSIISMTDGTGTLAGEIHYIHDGDYMQFKTATSERMRIQSGGGISFNGDTAAANALDDYEEGTFTATLADSGGGATLTLNSAYNALAYTKIGRQVHIQGVLVVSGVSGTANGTLQINNLPFASAGLVDQAGKSGGCGVSIYQVQKYSSGVFPVTSLAESSTTLQIQLGVVDANTYPCYANTATQLYFDFTYITAT